jgi:hypothetical protein
MPKIGLVNMLIGFSIVFLAAAAGSFIATDITYKFLREQNLSDSWMSLMQKSAHGHTNLFGILHICLGLTLPYSRFKNSFKILQTIGLGLGSFAMSFLMVVRGQIIPSESFDYLGTLIGICLSAALLSIGGQVIGLLWKLRET